MKKVFKNVGLWVSGLILFALTCAFMSIMIWICVELSQELGW